MTGEHKVALLGLGSMGVHMAAALARAGWTVSTWSRRPPACAGGPGGTSWHAKVEDAVAGADVIVVMLTDAAAVNEVLFDRGAAAACKSGSVIVDMGTTGPDNARNVFKRLKAMGIGFADAPVSGGTIGARNGDLSIFVGADAATLSKIRPVLASMGRPNHMGPVGAGQIAKLANQLIVGITIAAVAEGLSFAEAQGVNPSELLVALEGGFADSQVLRTHGPRMAARDYSAGGALRLHLKDLRLASRARSDELEGLPHSRRVLEVFGQLAASGKGNLDHSAYFEAYGMSASHLAAAIEKFVARLPS